MIEINVIHRLGMTFQCPLELPGLPVPDFHSCIFASRGENGVLWMEGDASEWRTMACEDMCCWCSGQPVRLGSGSLCRR